MAESGDRLLPALALGMEPVEKTVMRQPPRGKQDPLFSRAFSLRLAWQGAMVGRADPPGLRTGAAADP
ncbi:MAG: cation-translocating P-type ATPase C-terminal domain-containing protein [Evtepia gabavorous]